ncbi:MAG TPA: class I SAM-dependent methyltransferase [Planctomycetota bacterium]|nr:class I SAM-dependent methyltransferase [Planctomycetota bacterium]
MPEQNANFAERAYGHRSFEHNKRTTFAIITNIAKALQRPLRIADLSCGTAVLPGILCEELGKNVEYLHLIDVDRRFLELAQEYLAPKGVPLKVDLYNLNEPASYPALDCIDLAISTNALFHATAQVLPEVYKWLFTGLKSGGLLINHQTFGFDSSAGSVLYGGPLKSLTPNAALDALDREIGRRTGMDQKKFASPSPHSGGGRYAGVNLRADHHLRLLTDCGFHAEEVWRFGQSAVIVALRP